MRVHLFEKLEPKQKIAWHDLCLYMENSSVEETVLEKIANTAIAIAASGGLTPRVAQAQ
jgi:hypothetical protein